MTPAPLIDLADERAIEAAQRQYRLASHGNRARAAEHVEETVTDLLRRELRVRGRGQ